jgi:hypothetical protein
MCEMVKLSRFLDARSCGRDGWKGIDSQVLSLGKKQSGSV